MITSVPLLGSDQIARLPERAREFVEYRKSGGRSRVHLQWRSPLDPEAAGDLRLILGAAIGVARDQAGAWEREP